MLSLQVIGMRGIIRGYLGVNLRGVVNPVLLFTSSSHIFIYTLIFPYAFPFDSMELPLLFVFYDLHQLNIRATSLEHTERGIKRIVPCQMSLVMRPVLLPSSVTMFLSLTRNKLASGQRGFEWRKHSRAW